MLDIDVTEPERGVVVVALQGSLDFLTADALERRLGDLLQPAVSCVVFDLQGLEVVTSSGLRVFLMADKRLRARGGQARFCSPNDNIGKLFDLTGLRAHAQIYPSLTAALVGVKPKQT